MVAIWRRGRWKSRTPVDVSCEFRLLLRPDTARDRLGSIAHDYRSIDSETLAANRSERDQNDRANRILNETVFLPRADHNALLQAQGLEPLSKPISAADLLRRPNSRYAQVAAALAALGRDPIDFGRIDAARVESEIRYGAFLERESREVARHAAFHDRALPDSLEYGEIPGMRIEAASKLARHKPRTIGEAGRLAGVTPSDIGALLVHLNRASREPVPA